MSAEQVRPTSSREPGGSARRTVEPQRARVLLAEDNAANRKVAVAMLKKLGYAADVAVNGIEVVEAVAARDYDAILMDCRMPEMDGFRATEEIRRREGASAHTPIIAMTADAMEGDRQRCLEAGMDDYLSKPVSFDSLDAVLERWISNAGQARQPTRTAGSTSPPGVGEPPLDSGIIAGLRNLEKSRDGEWMPELVTVFLRDAGSHLEELRLAVEQGDIGGISERSHALSGSVATLGARGMGELCVQLNTLGSHGHLEAAQETLARLNEEFERVRTALRAEFPSSGETAG